MKKLSRRETLRLTAVSTASLAIGYGSHAILDPEGRRPDQVQIVQDFLSGNTIVYKGLLLSQSEYDWLRTRHAEISRHDEIARLLLND